MTYPTDPFMVLHVRAKFFIALLILTSSLAVQAKVIERDHVRVQVISSESVTPESMIGVHFRIDPEWHIYWRNPGDSGAAPKFEIGNGEITEILWPYPERIPVGELTNYGYSHEVVIFLKMKNLGPQAVLNLEWLVCKVDCIPGFGEIELEAESVALEPELFQKFLGRLPSEPTYSEKYLRGSPQSFEFSLAGIDVSKFANLFVFPHDGLRFLTQAPKLTLRPDGVDIAVPASANSSTQSTEAATFTVVGEQSSGSTEAFVVQVTPTTSAATFLLGLLLALCGGLLLNLMPCVFPVLFLKGYGFLKASDPVVIRRSSWIYTAGVLVSFFMIGTALLMLRFFGESIGWGFQLQSPVMVAFLAGLFFVMGLSFLDVLSLDRLAIPLSWSKRADKYLSGDFGVGVLAVVVASPCTAPFMGTALGLTLLLPGYQALAIFLAIGVGLAAPVPLMAHWPGLIQRLPRSGPWMIRLKKLMALPLFATSLWLVWVLSTQVGGPEASASWHPYNEAVITERRKTQPVFIDFTASWCITCQVNKRTTLDTAEIQKLFKVNGVYLVRADWTNHDPVITNALAQFQRNSVPLYVYYDSMGSRPAVLPTLLTKNDIQQLFSKGEAK